MNDQGTALVWESGTYAGWCGYLPVGESKRIRIAAISWGLTRDPAEPWVLSTELPGFSGKQWKFATEHEAMAKADKLLSSFATWALAALREATG